MRLWMGLLLMSETGISCATRRSAGFFGAGKMAFIPRTIAKSVEYCHATHRNTPKAHTREDAHNGARRAHALLLREAQQEPDERRPAADRHGSHGKDAGENTDERPLLHQARVRRFPELLEEILVALEAERLKKVRGHRRPATPLRDSVPGDMRTQLSVSPGEDLTPALAHCWGRPAFPVRGPRVGLGV